MGLGKFCEPSLFLSFSSLFTVPHTTVCRKEGQKQTKGDGYTKGLKSPLKKSWWTYCTPVL